MKRIVRSVACNCAHTQAHHRRNPILALHPWREGSLRFPGYLGGCRIAYDPLTAWPLAHVSIPAPPPPFSRPFPSPRVEDGFGCVASHSARAAGPCSKAVPTQCSARWGAASVATPTASVLRTVTRLAEGVSKGGKRQHARSLFLEEPEIGVGTDETVPSLPMHRALFVIFTLPVSYLHFAYLPTLAACSAKHVDHLTTLPTLP